MTSKKLLFLGYSETKTCLHELIANEGWDISHTEEKVSSVSEYDLCVSFGYRFIIPEEVIKSATRPILNCHIAYLPYNRGANPNFWSFYEGSPPGVTIHEMDKGIDTGPICFQKYVNFGRREDSFSLTYSRLILEIESLFKENINDLLSGTYTRKLQRGKGSFHNVRDLPSLSIDWNSPIEETLRKIDLFRENDYERDMKLVDEIQKVRTGNNVNWMDLLRLGLRCHSKEAKEILNRINFDDGKISELFKELGK